MNRYVHILACDLKVGDQAVDGFVLSANRTTHGGGSLMLITLSNRPMPILMDGRRHVRVTLPHLIEEQP